jgi:hypothetical protein
MNRPQQEGSASNPIGQRRPIELDSLPSIDLSLPIKRKVIGIFVDQDLVPRCLQSAIRPRSAAPAGRLYDHVLAPAAAIFGPADNEHPELRRHDVETFAGILADPMQGIATARASVAFDVDHHFDARQVSGKRSAVHAALAGAAGLLGRIGHLNLGLGAGRDLLELFEPEQHLIFGSVSARRPKRWRCNSLMI